MKYLENLIKREFINREMCPGCKEIQIEVTYYASGCTSFSCPICHARFEEGLRRYNAGLSTSNQFLNVQFIPPSLYPIFNFISNLFRKLIQLRYWISIVLGYTDSNPTVESPIPINSNLVACVRAIHRKLSGIKNVFSHRQTSEPTKSNLISIKRSRN